MKPNEKIAITLDEAAEYSGIGVNTLRRIVNDDKSIDWVFFVGDKKMPRIKRRLFDRWILSRNTI